jgi:hypothetical protein
MISAALAILNDAQLAVGAGRRSARDRSWLERNIGMVERARGDERDRASDVHEA